MKPHRVHRFIQSYVPLYALLRPACCKEVTHSDDSAEFKQNRRGLPENPHVKFRKQKPGMDHACTNLVAGSTYTPSRPSAPSICVNI